MQETVIFDPKERANANTISAKEKRKSNVIFPLALPAMSHLREAMPFGVIRGGRNYRNFTIKDRHLGTGKKKTIIDHRSELQILQSVFELVGKLQSIKLLS